MKNNTLSQKNIKNDGVKRCKLDLSRYFHPLDLELNKRFETLYGLFGLNDEMIASKVGIDRTTMNRYRRGIFRPSKEMKFLIAQKITDLAKYPVDSAVIWGEDLFFDRWKEEKKEDDTKTENPN